MIALCREHHDKADAGAYTVDQLRGFKQNVCDEGIGGKFDWLRKEIVGVVGGGFFFDVREPLASERFPIVWFTVGSGGMRLLNIDMPSLSGLPRFSMRENIWSLQGQPADFKCPPSGRLVELAYPNGDYLRVEFRVIESPDEVQSRYGHVEVEAWPVEYPVTTVEVRLKVGGGGIEVNQKEMRLGESVIRMGYISGFSKGVVIP
ncbi:MAG: hypothetical protein AAGI52_14575 [Bacteroidota bacterium]